MLVLVLEIIVSDVVWFYVLVGYCWGEVACDEVRLLHNRLFLY